MKKIIRNQALASALLATGIPVHAASFDVTIESNRSDLPTTLAATVHLPGSAGADSTTKVPMILHSHGWGGGHSKGADSFQAYLDAGFGVLSFAQRGHGDTGGTAQMQNPEYEGKDVIAIIDYIAAQPWSLKNGDIDLLPNGKLRKDQGKSPAKQAADKDPVLFSIGGSYGGGYQWAGMLTELRDTGGTRFDGMAPQITWHSLPQSLAPSDVPRTLYVSGLYGSKLAQGPQTMPDALHTSYAYLMVTGNLPDGTVPGTTDIKALLLQSSPKGYGLDGKVEIPVLTRQGTTDSLFNMNQGYYNHQVMLSEKAKARSLFIGYNGGHGALNPTGLLVPGVNPSGDPCSEAIIGTDFTDLTIAFFQSIMAGENPRKVLQADKPFHVASDTNGCMSADNLDANTAFSAASLEVPGVGSGTAAFAGLGAPVVTPIPGTAGIRIAGIPRLEGTAYAAAAETRVFLALAKGPLFDPGASPNRMPTFVIQNQVMPLRFALPATGEAIDLALAGVAAELAPDEQLYLVAYSIHDQFIAHGSRAPGGLVITSPKLHLPVR